MRILAQVFAIWAVLLIGLRPTHGTDLYFAENDFGAIYRIDSSSANVQRVFPLAGDGIDSDGLAFDSVRNRVMWLGGYAGQWGLFAADATTFEAQLLLPVTDGSIRHPAVDPVTGSVYFEYSQGVGGRHNPKQIVRWNAASNSMETIVSSVDYTTAIAVDPVGRWLYWSQHDQGWPHELLRAPLDRPDGNEPQLVFEHEFRGPAGLAFDFQRQQVHWIGSETDAGSTTVFLDEFDVTVRVSQLFVDDSALQLVVDVPSGDLFMTRFGNIDGVYEGGTLPGVYADWLAIDSAFVVPEPESLFLAGCGVWAFALLLVRRRHESAGRCSR
jgi:hypothetical protein